METSGHAVDNMIPYEMSRDTFECRKIDALTGVNLKIPWRKVTFNLQVYRYSTWHPNRSWLGCVGGKMRILKLYINKLLKLPRFILKLVKPSSFDGCNRINIRAFSMYHRKRKVRRFCLVYVYTDKVVCRIRSELVI